MCKWNKRGDNSLTVEVYAWVEEGCHIRHHVEHMVNVATERPKEMCAKNNNTVNSVVNIFYEEIVSIYSESVFISLYSINLSRNT